MDESHWIELSQQLGEMRRDIAGIKETLAQNRPSVEKIENLNDQMIELKTKFSIVWGVMALIGTTAGSALVITLMTVVKHP